MAISKLNFWLGIVFFFTIFSFGVISVGTALSDRVTLTDDSLTYIDLMDGEADNNDVDDLARIDATESKQVSYITGDNETGNVVGTDNVGVLFYFKNIASSIENTFKVALNAPSTMIIGLGLPVSSFRGFLNIIVYLAGLGVTIAIVRGLLK